MNSQENVSYSAPQTVELGELTRLTKGTCTSPIWDMGSGLKPHGGSGGGGSLDPDNAG